MLIHVVKEGDTIDSIAESYNKSVIELIRDNGIENPNELVIGQCIVIVFPEQTHIVQNGDSLQSIADMYQIPVTQLYKNNPFLVGREFLYPSETLVIKYNNNKGKIAVHGNSFTYIEINALRKTLPYLTYLSIINYTAMSEGDILTYYDDTEIIKITKAYGVMPLMLLTTLSIRGEANVGITYDILLSAEYQNKQIDNILKVLKEKGYYGLNLSLQSINAVNLRLYEDYIAKIYYRLNNEGFYVFVTVNPAITVLDDELSFQHIDYSFISYLSNNIIFMNYDWATNINPPSPILSIQNIKKFLEYSLDIIPKEKVIIGLSTIGYDWQLPFVAGISNVNSLSISNCINLANDFNAIIEFDPLSQTPFFHYYITEFGKQIQHIVWFIDARSINALLDLTIDYQIQGIGIWNITIYNPQLWLIINSQYEILKISPL